MNHIYRLVWSRLSNSWVAVAETAKGRGKGSGRQLVVAALSLSATVAYALPTGGQVVAGTGHISRSGNTTTIQQSSQNLLLNFQSFNIAPHQTVNFVQPSASAIAVNRIFDTNGTKILGHLNANGQVFLINPNGVLFGRGAQVNVGGLVASSLDLSNASLSGNVRTFSGNGTGSVINRGTITSANGGYVALLGNTVSNQGTIVAQLGNVSLGAGSAATLTFSGNQLVHMQVDQSTLNNLAQNGGLIEANGGIVLMTAGAQDALLASVVNNTGVIEARTVENHNGTITLLGGMTAGQVNVGGTLDASAPNGGNGGFINTSAAHVNVADGARITTAALLGLTGTWLIDPQDFTVAASGGDLTGSTLSSELANNNITLESSQGGTAGSGNVNIDDAVTWSANTALTLIASNNVNVNANITATGATAGLVMNPNTANGGETVSGSGNFILGNGAAITLTGANPSLQISGQTYTVINSLGGLQGINGNLTGLFALGSNIDASVTATWSDGAGFMPIGSLNGDEATPFTGIFDGLGHTITNLTIDRPSTSGVGLFGAAVALIQNVGLVGGSVSGANYTGALVGLSRGTVGNSFATGSVSGTNQVGGLIGRNYGTISNSYATGSVSASSDLSAVGGLVGASFGTISNSHATGSVSGSSYVGGLVGANGGTISNSYATGSVSGSSYVGGLVGVAFAATAGYGQGTISNSYATGSVSGSNYVGGLVGANVGILSNSFATGAVSGTGQNIGGLVGRNYGTVTGSYAMGSVSGNLFTGGLVGLNYGTVTGSYAMGSVNGSLGVGGLVGLNDNNDGPGTISNSYATGSVSGSSFVGGLVGDNAGTISDTYATGSVTGTSDASIGGLVGGSDEGTVTNSFWDTTTTGQNTSAGGVGLTTAQMQTQADFTSATAANGEVNPGWDFANTWVMYEGQTDPLLRSFMTALTVTANNATTTFNGKGFSGGNGVTFSMTPNSNLLGTVTFGGTSQGAVNVGSYSIAPSGLFSNQQGYIITYVSGALTVNPAVLTETATPTTITAGQSPTGLTGTVTGFVAGNTLANATTGTLVFTTPATASSAPGSFAIDGSGLTAQNYIFVQAPSNAQALTVIAAAPPAPPTPPVIISPPTPPVVTSPTAPVPPIATSPAAPAPATPIVVSNTVSQIDAVVTSAEPQSPNAPPTVTPTITTAPIIASIAPPANDSSAPFEMVNTTLNIGGSGTLQVVDDGINVTDTPRRRQVPDSSRTAMTCPVR